MTLGRRLAAPTAVIAMIGAVGWIGGASMARGTLSPVGILLVVLMSLAVGAVVYSWMQYMVLQALQPFTETARALRDAAARPRDHIAAFRRQATQQPVLVLDEHKQLVEALTFLLSRIEDRQLRQAAWAGALVHDVKTPVAAAANALAAVSKGDVRVWTEEERELVDRVAVELRKLSLHVQKLMDAIRLEREDVELALAEVDLTRVVCDVLQGVPGRDCVEVRWSGEGRAFGDATLLTRVLENLVANAHRYARSYVSVDVFPGLVRVTDDGPGLPAPLEVLAEPFRSAAIEIGGETLHGGAAGMGLYLSRRVLELHRGKLVVERTDTSGTVILAYIGGTRGGGDAR